jgi:hypothetical protein
MTCLDGEPSCVRSRSASDDILDLGGEPDGGLHGAIKTLSTVGRCGARAASVISPTTGLMTINGRGVCCCGSGPAEFVDRGRLQECTWWSSL